MLCKFVKNSKGVTCFCYLSRLWSQLGYSNSENWINIRITCDCQAPHPRVSDSAVLRASPRIYISNRFTYNPNEPHLEPLVCSIPELKFLVQKFLFICSYIVSKAQKYFTKSSFSLLAQVNKLYGRKENQTGFCRCFCVAVKSPFLCTQWNVHVDKCKYVIVGEEPTWILTLIGKKIEPRYMRKELEPG